MEKRHPALKSSSFQQRKVAADPITGEQNRAGGSHVPSKIKVQQLEVKFWGDPATLRDAAARPGAFQQIGSSSSRS